MSLVRVVLADVTECVGPEVGIRDMRAGMAGTGGVSPGGEGNVVIVAWERGLIVGLRPCSAAAGVHIGGSSSGAPNIGIGYVIPHWK